jgi:putative membrane protein
MNLIEIKTLAARGALVLALSAPAFSYSQNTRSTEASSADKSFVKNAIEGDNAEVELGQMAMTRGDSLDVKRFGKKMVDDHTQMGERMTAVAEKIGVTPSKMMPPSDKALEMKLKMLSNEGFDRAYIKAMVKDHRQDLADFEREAATGTSSMVKSAAAHGEQILSSHLEMIQRIAQGHNVTVAQNSNAK